MKLSDVQYTFNLYLDENETERFKRRFPSSKDIEALVEDQFEEPGTQISIHESGIPNGNLIYFTIEIYADLFPFCGVAKKEALRITKLIERVVLED